MRLILVRHGESVWNAEGRVQGQRCAGLSARGHAQAALTAQALAERYPDATLVTSDLQRTVETAAPLAKALGRDAREDPRLRERHFGAWEGELRTDIALRDVARWERWCRGHDVLEEVGGETVAGLTERVTTCLSEVVAAAGGQAVIAVTHGGPVYNGVHRLLDLPIPSLGAVANASITELLLPLDGGHLLDRWNEVGHLTSTTRSPAWRGATDGPPVGR